MQKILISLAILCSLSLSPQVIAQAAEPTAPTEVGKTTMPAGQYLMTEISSGKQYSLTVTDKGTMIFGPAPATTAQVSTASAVSPPSAKGASGVTGLAEKEMQRFIQKQGMSQVQNLVK